MKRVAAHVTGAAAVAAVGAVLLLSNGDAPVPEPAALMTWEQSLRASADKDGLTAEQVGALEFADVCGRLGIDHEKPVPEAFFYWKVSRRVSMNMAREVAEAKRAALIAETTDRLKTMTGMSDVVVAYEDGRLIITGGAITEANR